LGIIDLSKALSCAVIDSVDFLISTYFSSEINFKSIDNIRKLIASTQELYEILINLAFSRLEFLENPSSKFAVMLKLALRI